MGRIPSHEHRTPDEPEPDSSLCQYEGREDATTVLGHEEPNASEPSARVIEALALAGTWRDIDFDEMLEELDRIRHANPPTPPIEFDWLDEE